MKQETKSNNKKEGRKDIIKGIGWLLFPLLIGYLLYLLAS